MLHDKSNDAHFQHFFLRHSFYNNENEGGMKCMVCIIIFFFKIIIKCWFIDRKLSWMEMKDGVWKNNEIFMEKST